jgi:hypothetical protein
MDPMRFEHLGAVALAGLVALPACGTTTTPEISVSPPSVDVLTCGGATLTASVTGLSSSAVKWQVEGAPAAGTIDASGRYTAPIETPKAGRAVVTATSAADASLHASATLTLATAFPGARVHPDAAASNPWQGEPGVDLAHGWPDQWAAANGARVYAIFVHATSATTQTASVARSDDGGQTWDAGTEVTIEGRAIDAVAVAVDPADPDLVYAAYTVEAGSEQATTVTDLTSPNVAMGSSLVLTVSDDGGKTWTPALMYSSGADGLCDNPGLVAFGKDRVAVSCESRVSSAAFQPDYVPTDLWVDANRGAGFATGQLGAKTGLDCNEGGLMDCGTYGGYFANGRVPQILPSSRFDDDHLYAVNGRLCLSADELGYDMSTGQDVVLDGLLLCSDDDGHSFAAPTQFAVGEVGQPVLTFAYVFDAKGRPFAVEWDGAELILDPGGGGSGLTVPLPSGMTGQSIFNMAAAFDGSVLWTAFAPGGDDLVVDKSCDGGKTWSGFVTAVSAPPSQAGGPPPVAIFSSSTGPHVLYETGVTIVPLTATGSK